MDFFDKLDLPRGHEIEVPFFVCEGVEILEAMSVRSAFGGVPEDVFAVVDWEIVGLQVDAAAGLEERNCDGAFTGVAWTAVGFRVGGENICFNSLGESVFEDLVTDFGWDDAE